MVEKPLYFDIRTSACLPLAGSGCELHVACYARKRGIVVDMNSTKLTAERQRGYCLYYAIAAHFVGDKDVELMEQFVSVWGCPAGANVKLSDFSRRGQEGSSCTLQPKLQSRK